MQFLEPVRFTPLCLQPFPSFFLVLPPFSEASIERFLFFVVLLGANAFPLFPSPFVAVTPSVNFDLPLFFLRPEYPTHLLESFFPFLRAAIILLDFPAKIDFFEFVFFFIHLFREDSSEIYSVCFRKERMSHPASWPTIHFFKGCSGGPTRVSCFDRRLPLFLSSPIPPP